MLVLIGLLRVATAADITVDCSTTTFADAVTSANPGDTLILASECRSGPVVDIDKPLTIKGGPLRYAPPKINALSDGDLVLQRVTIACTRRPRVQADFVHLDLIDVAFEPCTQTGARVVSDKAWITVTNSTIADISSTDGVFSTSSGSATFDAVTVENLTGNADGSLLQGIDTPVSISDSSFRLNSAAGDGGLIALRPGNTYSEPSITSRRSVFEGNSAGGDGGVFYLEGGSHSLISDSTFRDNQASSGAAIRLVDSDAVVIERSAFIANSASLSGALMVDSTTGTHTLAIDHTRFQANTAGSQSAGLSTSGLSDVQLVASWFCGNQVGTTSASGSDLWAAGSPLTASTLRVSGSVFALNAGPAAIYTEDIDADLSNLSFAGNAATSLSPGAGTTLQLSSNLFLDPGNAIFASRPPSTSSGGYNALRDTTDWLPPQVPFINPFTDTLTFTDPGVVSWSAASTCADFDLWLTDTSPLIDAGDPAILDIDQTTVNVGAYGGSDAWYVDLDDDGVNNFLDCDDTDPNISPYKFDVAYNGIDEDCDGSDLVDVDNDGYDADQASGGSPDCDDNDPSIHPGATEIPYNGIDEDCIGGDEIDSDGDGYEADQASGGSPDCDDTDPNINPGATEIPYDGVDNDCADGDAVDVDGDGYPSTEVGGDDCDDNDDTVHPDADELPNDGIDQDCADGDLVTDDTTDTAEPTEDDPPSNGGKGKKGGCDVGGQGPMGAWLLLLPLALLRGRRRGVL